VKAESEEKRYIPETISCRRKKIEPMLTFSVLAEMYRSS
jgi:hypothetical protein